MPKLIFFFRPGKFIFRIISVLLLLVIIIPIVMIALMYDYSNYQVPSGDIPTDNSLSFTSLVASSIDQFLEDESQAVNISVSSSMANGLLITAFRQNNPYYLTDEGQDDERNYVTTLGVVKVKGATLTFRDDLLIIESGMDASLFGFNYRTKIYLEMSVIEDEIGYNIKIQKVNVGSLPVLPIYGLANWILKLTGVNLKEFISQTLPIGTIDADNLSAVITYQEIFELLQDEDENMQTLNLLSSLMTQRFGANEERIFDVGFVGDSAAVNINLGLIRTSEVPYLLTNQITSSAQLEQLFKGQITNLLISGLNSEPGVLNLDLHEVVVNQMLDYYLGENMKIEEELHINENTYRLSTEPVFINLTNEEAHFKIIFNLKKDGAEKYFKTVFNLVAAVKISDNQNDLIFDIKEVWAGDDSKLTDAMIDDVMALLSESEIVVGRQIIVKDFVTSILSSGVSVDDVLIVGQSIRFIVSPESQELTDLIVIAQSNIAQVLDNVVSNPDYQIVADALENYTDPDEIVAAINQLDPEVQEQFYNDLMLEYEQNDIDLSELIAQFSN